MNPNKKDNDIAEFFNKIAKQLQLRLNYNFESQDQNGEVRSDRPDQKT